MLGPDNLLHPKGEHAGAYVSYEFSSTHVKQHFERSKGFSWGVSHSENLTECVAWMPRSRSSVVFFYAGPCSQTRQRRSHTRQSAG